MTDSRIAACAGQGTMTENGYRPENYLALPVLIRDGAGLDPLKDLDPAQLTAAGHPRRPSATVLSAMRRYLNLDPGQLPEGMVSNRYTDMRDHCLTCAESVSEVRRCAIVDCAFWAYRMGRNPHNPRRGIDPFRETSEAMEARA